MSRLALSMVAAFSAFVAVWLFPSQSFAAILPACEADFETRTALPPDAPMESCESAANRGDGTRGDDIDNSRAAPICDAQGASAVAPPRIRGIADVRFERSRPCEAQDSARAAVQSQPNDPPVQSHEVTLERAVLPIIDVASRTAIVILLQPLAPTQGPREGVRGDIFHPPR